jgi:hypothetical protein
MRKLSAKWVPKCLNADQNRDRMLVSQAILDRFRGDPVRFSNRLVTMDETWIHIDDPETKEQSKELRHSGSPRPIPSSTTIPPEGPVPSVTNAYFAESDPASN